MKKDNQIGSYNNVLNVLAGFLIGSLAGAVTMLLLAPQSGKDTRMQIKQKGMDLRDETTEMMDNAVTQMQANANKFVSGGREKIKELTEHGRGLAAEQLDRVAEAAHAGKKAIQNT